MAWQKEAQRTKVPFLFRRPLPLPGREGELIHAPGGLLQPACQSFLFHILSWQYGRGERMTCPKSAVPCVWRVLCVKMPGRDSHVRGFVLESLKNVKTESSRVFSCFVRPCQAAQVHASQAVSGGRQKCPPF